MSDRPRSDECQIALETFLSGDDPDASLEHIEACPECAPLAEELARDQERLRQAFAETKVPPVPALELRDGLQSASGYPRRVSLTLMPFFIALMLLLTLLLIGLAYFAVDKVKNARFQSQVEPDLLVLQQRIAEKQRAGVVFDPTTDWRSHIPGAPRVDPLDQPYEIRVEDGKIVAYSVGRDGVDEKGRGDDISGEPVEP